MSGGDRIIRWSTAGPYLASRRWLGSRSSVLQASGLMVLTLAGERISTLTRFDNSGLSRFGLPRTLAD